MADATRLSISGNIIFPSSQELHAWPSFTLPTQPLQRLLTNVFLNEEIGTFALVGNGVPATDGGFIQILSTTTGSPSLQRVAAGNCLASDEDSSKHLRELKIRYGELVDMKVKVGGTVVRRAGFGTEDEVGPLKKGERYGVVEKIPPGSFPASANTTATENVARLLPGTASTASSTPLPERSASPWI